MNAHGFLLLKDIFSGGHVIRTFDVPNAPQGTYPSAINQLGTITGYYLDASFVGHGFLRDVFGRVTIFDPPGSAANCCIGGTYPFAIDNHGTIAGLYFDANYDSHGFLRRRDGSFVTFDVPGGKFHTEVYSMNQHEETTGTYFEPITGNPFGGNYRGFVRDRDGTFSTFDAATYAPCCIWTFSNDINDAGETTGTDNDGFDVYHGFIRKPDGAITILDVPGAGTSLNQGAGGVSINSSGTVTGYYIDTDNVVHAFVRTKKDE